MCCQKLEHCSTHSRSFREENAKYGSECDRLDREAEAGDGGAATQQRGHHFTAIELQVI